MSFYEIRILKEFFEKGYELDKIEEKMILDKQFRKEVLKKYKLVIINAIEYCIADKSRILSDINKKIYREISYDTDKIFSNEIIEAEPYFAKHGFLADTRLIEYIYYNKTIRDIYHLKYLEFIKNYKEEMPLSLIELIYPIKMPIKDYFPFVEFDIGTTIPLFLTEEEKQRYEYFLNYDIKKSDWDYCIFWIDKKRLFMNLDCNSYYFKQIDKNVHLFELTFQCV